MIWSYLHCTLKKKVSDFPIPIRLLPIMESLVSDIPAGDGKIANLFYSVGQLQKHLLFCSMDIEF